MSNGGYSCLMRQCHKWINSGSKKAFLLNTRSKYIKHLVKPVLLYNCNTWGLTKQELETIDRTHTNQLRKVWKEYQLKTEQVYEINNDCPVSHTITQSIYLDISFGYLKKFLHKTSMKYYFEIPQNAKKFPGMKRRILPEMINQDIKKIDKLNPDFPVKQFEKQMI